MSLTATLQMQDLDVADAYNHSSILMNPSASLLHHHNHLPPYNPPHTFDAAAAAGSMQGSDRRQDREMADGDDTHPPRGSTSTQPTPLSPRPHTFARFEQQQLLHHQQQQQHQISQEACDDQATAAEPKYCYRHRVDPTTGLSAEDTSLERVQRESEGEMRGMSQASRDSIHGIWSAFTAAPAKQRELMLRGILSQCCFPQLSMVSASVRELLKIDFLGALPPELGLRILCFLDAKSLCHAARVSKMWRRLSDDDVVWHRMCEQHIDRKCRTCGWGLPLLDQQRLQAERSLLRHRVALQRLPTAPLPLAHVRSAISHAAIHQYPDSASDDGEPGRASSAAPSSHTKGASRKRTAAAVMPEHLITIKKSCAPARNYEGVAEPYFPAAGAPVAARQPWKEVYRDRFLIGTNWKHGRCTQQVLRGHTGEITCLQFDDDIIATGSYDATIRIWDVETGRELRVLAGHTMGVKCLQFDKSKLVSGSLDGTLKMWDLRNGRVIRTFPGHSGAVVSVHFDGSILASGSHDRTIRVRDFANASRVSLKGHTDAVNAVRVDAASQMLFSASDDCTVRVWDLQAKRCLQVLRGHSLQVTQVVPMPCGYEFPSDQMDDEMMSRSEGSSGAGGSGGDGAGSSSRSSSADSAAGHVVSAGPPHRTATPAAATAAAMAAAAPAAPAAAQAPAPPQAPAPAPAPAPVATVQQPPHPPTLARAAAASPVVGKCPPRYILSSSMDSTVRMWDVSTGQCLRTFFGHVHGIWALAADTLRMVSGANDGVVKLWDPKSLRQERTFSDHRGPVTCVGLNDRRMVTASEDKEVRVYYFGAPPAREA